MSRAPIFLLVAALLAASPVLGKERLPTIDAGLAWLAKNQADNGSWGKRHSYSVTALACLAHLAASDEPYTKERGPALLHGIRFLIAQQNEGMFPAQGHTWIHGQGFATLALSESYGRALRCKQKPDLDLDRLKAVVRKAVQRIEQHQSKSGGWWYQPNDPNNHEGSTTVCAVQALVSASRHGVPIDQAVLDKGFEYLKQCQNPDGGFDYKLGPGTVSMKEGTAAGVATLALMRRFDYKVMIEGVRFLKTIGPGAIDKERFPYYGHFYACMGLKLFAEEMAATKEAAAYTGAAHKSLIDWQNEDGSWPQKGWMIQGGGEDGSYSTAFATLVLCVPEARLTIFNRPKPASG